MEDTSMVKYSGCLTLKLGLGELLSRYMLQSNNKKTFFQSQTAQYQSMVFRYQHMCQSISNQDFLALNYQYWPHSSRISRATVCFLSILFHDIYLGKFYSQFSQVYQRTWQPSVYYNKKRTFFSVLNVTIHLILRSSWCLSQWTGNSIFKTCRNHLGIFITW